MTGGQIGITIGPGYPSPETVVGILAALGAQHDAGELLSLVTTGREEDKPVRLFAEARGIQCTVALQPATVAEAAQQIVIFVPNEEEGIWETGHQLASLAWDAKKKFVAIGHHGQPIAIATPETYKEEAARAELKERLEALPPERLAALEQELTQMSAEEQLEPYTPPQQPKVRQQPKQGRNDPCSCGSGEKYKRCCLAKEDARKIAFKNAVRALKLGAEEPDA